VSEGVESEGGEGEKSGDAEEDVEGEDVSKVIYCFDWLTFSLLRL